MMIYLYTGLNGAGKTSSCLYDLLEVLKGSGRPFFASGINWTPAGLERYRPTIIEPAEWRDCPEGAVILVDEAQNSMPARPNTKDLPAWINELGTHRHKGHDIYLTTPHPMQIDVFARRLIGIHRHYVRAFSMSGTTRLENEGVMADPTNRLETHKAIVVRHKLRKSVYPYYVSTSLNTHKARIPFRKLALGLGVLGMFGAAGALGLHTWRNMTHSAAPGHPVAPLAAGVAAAVPSFRSSSGSAGSASSLFVVGSMSMAGRHVYLVENGKGGIYQATHCKIVNDAPMCAFGAAVSTLPDVAPVASVPASARIAWSGASIQGERASPSP